jgi:thioredoxin-like negative regulator of GroEL
MPLWNPLAGPSPEKLEQKGDALCAAGRWGMAKLEYERALVKLAKRLGPGAPPLAGLEGKIRQACEELARQHHANAAALLEGGHFDDVRELLELARELTRDPALEQTLEEQLAALAHRRREAAASEQADDLYGLDAPDDEDALEEEAAPVDAPEEDVFLALVSGLPEDVQQAYLGYGADFQAGYTALHRGDFAPAARLLEQAMTAHPGPQSLIPLELATAYLNLDRSTEARELLEALITRHPAALPAYQLLCEIHWEAGDFEAAQALLATLPAEFARSLAVVRLRGESLRRSGRPVEARDLYRGVLAAHGWHADLARDLARVLENTGDTDGARRLYRELMERCTACRTRIDPEIRERYAELTFAAGERGSALLELYLALARDAPERAALCFERAARICAHQGRAAEAQRFRALAARAGGERPGP